MIQSKEQKAFLASVAILGIGLLRIFTLGKNAASPIQTIVEKAEFNSNNEQETDVLNASDADFQKQNNSNNALFVGCGGFF
ncbi:hypothetical protein A2Z53_00640 [Candidatus Giovannonibacteria bacterium RIFCSPHIGHO2_02_42_15]|uniref:Uncharacterized protein n=2 Tax=Candidatus Giovannoniibacteriota TaxID=1752738 RepID=A0A1F5VMC3_9BACT|nr:MAG: hypothetical protein UV11_C0004G0005 [Candidatus Giovannonibacteria bacterium GW2011_GWF2_42_19]OGF64398.1 MAG: hypothetical protein A2Z53_00640 [Candidatus Giovannonibacteria bacterium RIFCSPHIGHO2_02_42_15]